MAEDNTVYIGNKPVINYVLAVVSQFNDGADEVIIKARGRAISRAVDTEQVTKMRFLPDVYTKEIRTATEELEGHKGDMVKVSSLEIFLAREKKDDETT